LGGNAPERVRVHPHAKFIAHLGFGVHLERLFQRNLLFRVGHLDRNFLEQEGLEFTELFIEGNVEIELPPVFLLDRRFDGFFQGMNQGLPVDAFLPTHLID